MKEQVVVVIKYVTLRVTNNKLIMLLLNLVTHSLTLN